MAPGARVEITFDARVRLPKATKGSPGDLSRNMGTYGVGPEVTIFGPFATVLHNSDEGHETDKMPLFGALGFRSVELSDLLLTVPANWVVFGTGVTVEEKGVGEGRKRVRLAGITSGGPWAAAGFGLDRVSTEARGMTINVYTGQGDTSWGQVIADDARRVLEAEIDLLGPVAHREVDLMGITTGLGGMYQGGGLVWLNRESFSSQRPERPAAFATERHLEPLVTMWGERARRRLVAHELAHLWWGGEPALLDTDYVPWLNEALTESTALHAIEKAYGPEEAERMRQWLGQTFQWWRLKGTADAPINLRPEQYQDLTQLSLLMYYKGALFLDTVRRQVGDERYYEAMRAHLTQNRFQRLTGEGPLSPLLADPAVKRLYERWVKGAHFDEDWGVMEVKDPQVRRMLGLP